MSTSSTSTTTTEAPAATTTEAPPETTTAAPEETTTEAPGSTTTGEPSSTTTGDPSTTTTAASGDAPTVEEVTFAIDPDDGSEHNPHSVQISSDAKLTITWSTQNAASVRIDPLPGPFDASGSAELKSEDASYTIVAVADGGAESAPYALEVHTHDPSEVVSSHTDVTSGVAKVISFTASTGDSAAAGASVELSIVASVDVESAKVGDDEVTLADSGDGHKTGTATVTIPDAGDTSVTYTCEASKDGAVADTATLTLEITPSTTTTTAPSSSTTSPSSSTTAPSSTTTAPSTTTTAPSTTTTGAPWDVADFAIVLLDAAGNPVDSGTA
ncbi:MAG TPA: hypothetical protein VH083_16950 [Myxococcales bacterium]|nr:hypothetical protein [Myxococcales bacterium]